MQRIFALLGFIALGLMCTIEGQVKRSVLLEVFSTERCNNCPLAHSNMERIFGDGGDSIIYLGHHAGFYTDDFTIAESVEYEWFYTPDRGTYAPAAMMDRTCGADVLPEIYWDGVPVFDGAKASCLKPAYAMAAEVPAYARVMAEVTYVPETRELQMVVTGKLLRQLPMVNDLRLNVFLTEDSVFTQTQAGAYGTYYHRHLARCCLTGTWGEKVEMEEAFERTYTYTLPDEWNEDKMQVVAFVSNYNAADRNNCQVLNATQAAVCDHAEQGVARIVEDAPSLPIIYNIFGQIINSNETLLPNVIGHAHSGQRCIALGSGLFLVR